MWRCILRSRSGRSHASSLPELGRLRPKGWSRVPVPRWRGLRDEPKEPLRGRLHQKKPPFYPKYIKSNVPCLSTDGFIFLSTVSWINKQMLLPRQMWVSSRYESNLSVWTNKVIHIQGSGGHCRCHHDSLHGEQLPFFHVFQVSMKRSWSTRHAPSPSRVTRSPRLLRAPENAQK